VTDDASASSTRRWPVVPGIAFGADYNPEQWPEDIWAQDVALMGEAGVSMVTVGVFSWALLEPSEGSYEFGWLDRVMDLLAAHGIGVDLATATASPPPWFSHRYPESLPINREGQRLWYGSRQAYCPSSADYRRASTALAGEMAKRYGSHPALVMWHVNNEYGCHVAECFCDASADAFRAWLRARYGDLARLNEAWGTAFWSQHYYDWAEVIPPRPTPTWGNPTQNLDWKRFCSDELLACYIAERDVLRAVTPHLPITTNFMGAFKPADYFSGAPEEDIVSNNHYVLGADPAGQVHLALAADLTRSLGEGRPWILMEHSTSAVNWQPRNLAKTPGQMKRNSLQHVARGADAVCFFQWRASRSGSEKFHSAMVPHAGTDTKVWREVAELGADLVALAEVAGSRVESEVAIVWDWPAWWAVELASHPSVDVRYLDLVRETYEALWRLDVTVDFVKPDADLRAYKVVAIPSLYLASDQAALNVASYVEGGGHLVCNFFSGIVDPDDAIRLGGYPGAFRELLGVRVEEFYPLLENQHVALADGSTGRIWSEALDLDGAKALTTYLDGPLHGKPAITRHDVGAGVAYYVSTLLDAASTARLLGGICDDAGVLGPGYQGGALRAPIIAATGVETVRRRASDGSDTSYLFVINHTDREVDVPAAGDELLTHTPVTRMLRVAPGAVAVVRESPRAPVDGPG
jgi:beta-galactosidase